MSGASMNAQQGVRTIVELLSVDKPEDKRMFLQLFVDHESVKTDKPWRLCWRVENTDQTGNYWGVTAEQVVEDAITTLRAELRARRDSISETLERTSQR